MKAKRFAPHHDAVHAAPRVIIGHCPNCWTVLVVLNAHEVWPWIECVCSWEGATTELTNRVRLVALWRLPITSAESPADLDREGR